MIINVIILWHLNIMIEFERPPLVDYWTKRGWLSRWRREVRLPSIDNVNFLLFEKVQQVGRYVDIPSEKIGVRDAPAFPFKWGAKEKCGTSNRRGSRETIFSGNWKADADRSRGHSSSPRPPHSRLESRESLGLGSSASESRFPPPLFHLASPIRTESHRADVLMCRSPWLVGLSSGTERVLRTSAAFRVPCERRSNVERFPLAKDKTQESRGRCRQ